MEKQFKPLDRGEVLSVSESVQILIGHSTFRVDELAQALKAQLLEHNIGGLTEEKTGWFNTEGAECQVLRYGAGNWQKGKVRISFEFCPNEPNGFPTAKTAVVSPPETTVATAPMGFREEAIASDEVEEFLEPIELPPTDSSAAEMERGEEEEYLLESVELSGVESDDAEEFTPIEETEDLLASAEEPAMDELAGVEEESSVFAEETEDVWAEKEDTTDDLVGSSLVEAETEKLWFDEEETPPDTTDSVTEEVEEFDEGLVEDIFDDAPDTSPEAEESAELDEGLVEDIFDDAPDESPFEEESEESDGELVENIFDGSDEIEEEEADIFAKAPATTPTIDETDTGLEFEEEDIFAESLATSESEPEVEDTSDSIFDTNAFDEEESSLAEEVFADVSDDELDLGDAFGSDEDLDLAQADNAPEVNEDLNFEDEEEDELFSSIDEDLDWGTSDDDELALDDSSESSDSAEDSEKEEAVFADIWQDIDEFS